MGSYEGDTRSSAAASRVLGDDVGESVLLVVAAARAALPRVAAASTSEIALA